MTHNTKITLTSHKICDTITGHNDDNYTIIINFTVDNDKKQNIITDKIATDATVTDDYIYHDYLSISTDDPNLLLSDWIASKEPIDRYDALLKKNKKIYTTPFTITMNATKRDLAIPYSDKANIHVIYYGKSDNQINHEFVPFISSQKQLDTKLNTQQNTTIETQLNTEPHTQANTKLDTKLNKKTLDNKNSPEQKNIQKINMHDHHIHDYCQDIYFYVKQRVHSAQNNYQSDYYLPFYLQWFLAAAILFFLGIRQLRRIHDHTSIQKHIIQKYTMTKRIMVKTIICMIMIASSILCATLALKSWYIYHQKANIINVVS